MKFIITLAKEVDTSPARFMYDFHNWCLATNQSYYYDSVDNLQNRMIQYVKSLKHPNVKK